MTDRDDFLESRTSFLLTFVSGVALVCRVIALGRKSFTGDESVTYLLAKADWHRFWLEVSSHELNMVPYYALMRGWIHLGTSEFILRLLGTVFAVATIPVLYLLAKRLFSREIALVSCLLLAVNTGHIFYSQEARAYTMAVFVCTAAALYLVKSIEHRTVTEQVGVSPLRFSPSRNDKSKNFVSIVALVALSAFAVYVHFFCLFVLVGFGLAVIVSPNFRERWTGWVVASFAMAGLVAPAVWYMKTHNVGQLDWVPPLSASSISKVPTLWAGSPAALVFYAAFWVIAIWFGLRQTQPRTQGRWKYWFLLLWMLVPLAITILLSLRQSILVERYLLISIPAAIILAADGLSRMGKAHVCLLVLVVLISIGANLRLYSRRSLHDGRSASQLVLRDAGCADTVLFVPSSGSLPFEYYRDRTHLLDHCGSNTALHFRTTDEGILPTSQNIWIVVMGPKQMPGQVQEDLQRAESLIPAGYRLHLQQSFEAYRVDEYSRQ